MYVIAAMECMRSGGRWNLTQLAAIRVDSDWNVLGRFDTYVQPIDPSFHQWGDVAYMGGTPFDFLYACNSYHALRKLCDFVGEDTLCLWSDQEAVVYTYYTKLALNGIASEPILLNKYVYGFLDGQRFKKGNPYRIAAPLGIDVPAIQHDARNDALAIVNLMQGIGFPQEALTAPPITPVQRLKTAAEDDLPYQYEAATGILHKRGCALLSQEAEVIGYGSLATPLRKKYRPCDCVRADVRIAKRERVIKEIEDTHYTYLYAVDGSVFHRGDCWILHNADHVHGTTKYATVLEKGLRPCKVCRPDESDELPHPRRKKTVVEQKPKEPKKPKKDTYVGLTREEINAITRQKQSQAERHRRADDKNMTPQQREDFYTLTQPRYAFFAAQGYLNFHTRTCARLQGISGVRGFETYGRAKNAGFTPCKHCKPTKKQNVLFSIPIESKARKGETAADLVALCEQLGYEHYMEEKDFYLKTAAGKWIIHTADHPVSLHHINLLRFPECEVYHVQPRLFLSLQDALYYIHKHDSNLLALSPKDPTIPEDDAV